MFEVKGDLWTLPSDAIAITTNGMVKENGECVMGRGCALEAKTMMPGIEFKLGELILNDGNNVHLILSFEERDVISFPVKHNWYEKADLELIEQSCIQLVDLVNELTNASEYPNHPFIAVPRPGCGNGQLSWDDVRPICKKYFDNRFGVVFK